MSWHPAGGSGKIQNLTGKLWLDKLHGDVVHDFPVHGHRDLRKAVGGQHRVLALIYHLPLKQPPVETVFGCIDT